MSSSADVIATDSPADLLPHPSAGLLIGGLESCIRGARDACVPANGLFCDACDATLAGAGKQGLTQGLSSHTEAPALPRLWHQKAAFSLPEPDGAAGQMT